METIKTTTVRLRPVKVLTPNGFSHGLVTKRPATTCNHKGSASYHEEYSWYCH